jgi:rhomboid protease GluP
MEERLPDGLKTLLIFLGLIYLLEVVLSGSFNPPPQSLAQLGGSGLLLVKQSSTFWLRVCTALFLHGNIMHLLSNSVGLLIGGPFLERIIGKYWFWTVFLYAGLAGSVFSVLFGSENVVSVGASGGVMGIYSAALVIANWRISPEYRKNLNIIFLQSMVPSLIPLSRYVDYHAHFGGALGGAIMGFLVLSNWPMHFKEPQNSFLALFLIFAFMLASGLAVYLTVLPTLR